MAKKTGTKRADTKTVKAPPEGQGREIHPNVKAMVWTLTEEGLSQRQVAERLKISAGTVSKELASDPLAQEALRARQREDRALRWRKIEDLGLDETIAFLELVKRYREDKKLTTREKEIVAQIPRFIQACRHTGETASKQVQLLTGGLTERVGQAGDQNPDENPETLIQTAIELDAVDMLPPRLKLAAQAELKRRSKLEKELE